MFCSPFEAFCWNISLSANLLFLKSAAPIIEWPDLANRYYMWCSVKWNLSLVIMISSILHQFCQFTWVSFADFPLCVYVGTYVCVSAAALGAQLGCGCWQRGQLVCGWLAGWQGVAPGWPLHECWGVTYLNRLRALHSQEGRSKMQFFGGLDKDTCKHTPSQK